MTEQTFETISGVEGIVGVRVMDYGGQVCLEVEPQHPRYGREAADGVNIPPILRIPIEADTPEEVAKAKTAVPEGLKELFEDAG